MLQNFQNPQLLELMQNTLHDIRYRFDHFVINQTQRYYSDNYNPRIIQTKLQDQTLLSLRTCPHDKYLVKRDEYLTLQRESSDSDFKKTRPSYDDYKHSDEFKMRQSEYMNNGITERVGEMIFKLDDSYLQPFKKRFPDFIKPQSDPGQELISLPTTPRKACTCGCHPEAELPDIIDMSSIISPKTKRLRKMWRRRIEKKDDQEYDNQLEKRDRTDTKERDKNERDHKIEGDHKNERDHNKELRQLQKNEINLERKNGIWKTVLNDISLSAARVSTGDVPKSSHHFQNLSSDFIDAKSTDENSNQDVFAINLQQAKLKYISPTNYDQINCLTSESSNSEYPNNSARPLSYDSFLDMYNFPTMGSI
jgi:hypothetical protein